MNKGSAFRLIILLGAVSLLADVVYEGARGVAGPYMAHLGAGAAAVGLVAGIGEFSGYALRLATGYIADRTGAYWAFTLAGYAMVFAVPFLALTGRWETAALIIVLERMGKAVRTPSRDAIISHASASTGRGMGFALHELMDQAGGILGPLIFMSVFLLGGGYREGFALTIIPAFLAMAVLLVAIRKYPSPVSLESPESVYIEARGLPKVFKLYMIFTFFSVAGFSGFQLISFHLKTGSVASDFQIPLLYMIAMGVDGVAALAAGYVFDKKGPVALLIVPLLSSLIPFFAFSNVFGGALAGVVLWGVVLGVHETVMRAVIAGMVPSGRRGTAYGIFNAAYGLGFLAGNTAIGFLYGRSMPLLLSFVLCMEAVALYSYLGISKGIAHGRS